MLVLALLAFAPEESLAAPPLFLSFALSRLLPPPRPRPKRVRPDRTEEGACWGFRLNREVKLLRFPNKHAEAPSGPVFQQQTSD